MTLSKFAFRVEGILEMARSFAAFIARELTRDSRSKQALSAISLGAFVPESLEVRLDPRFMDRKPPASACLFSSGRFVSIEN